MSSSQLRLHLVKSQLHFKSFFLCSDRILCSIMIMQIVCLGCLLQCFVFSWQILWDKAVSLSHLLIMICITPQVRKKCARSAILYVVLYPNMLLCNWFILWYEYYIKNRGSWLKIMDPFRANLVVICKLRQTTSALVDSRQMTLIFYNRKPDLSILPSIRVICIARDTFWIF